MRTKAKIRMMPLHTQSDTTEVTQQQQQPCAKWWSVLAYTDGELRALIEDHLQFREGGDKELTLGTTIFSNLGRTEKEQAARLCPLGSMIAKVSLPLHDFLKNGFVFLLEYNCFTMLSVSAVQNHESVICVYIYPLLLEHPSHCRLPLPRHPSFHLSRLSSQSTELSFLCYTAPSCQLSVLHISTVF